MYIEQPWQNFFLLSAPSWSKFLSLHLHPSTHFCFCISRFREPGWAELWALSALPPLPTTSCTPVPSLIHSASYVSFQLSHVSTASLLLMDLGLPTSLMQIRAQLSNWFAWSLLGWLSSILHHAFRIGVSIKLLSWSCPLMFNISGTLGIKSPFLNTVFKVL